MILMTDPRNETLSKSALQLAHIGQDFYGRGWVLGTSGNFSAVVNQTPLRLLITASGMHKGQLTMEQFVQIDEQSKVIAGAGRPSDETKRRNGPRDSPSAERFRRRAGATRPLGRPSILGACQVPCLMVSNSAWVC